VILANYSLAVSFTSKASIFMKSRVHMTMNPAISVESIFCRDAGSALVMKLLIVLATATLFLLPSAFLAQEGSAKRTFDAAVLAIDSGNYREAEAGFKSILSTEPHNVSALANLGVLYARTHRLALAIDVYKKVLRIQPGLREIQLDLGLAYLKVEEYGQALPYFEKSHQQDPFNQQAIKLLATCLISTNRTVDGINLLKPLTETEAPDPAAEYLLGIAYSKVGQGEQAKKVFTQLFSRDATPTQTNFLLGKAYYEAVDFKAAEQAFQAVVEADASFPGAHRELGKTYIGLHRDSQARSEFESAISADPEDASAYYYLGALLVQSGRFQDGVKYLKQMQTMEPDSWAVYFYMGKAEVELHKIADAISDLVQASNLNPDDSGALYLLARAYREGGRVSDANATMQRVVALHTTALDAERHALHDAGIVKEP
jgi:tetratricopeptide (TPR) repeat protein